MKLTLEIAEKIIEASRRKAQEAGIPMCLAAVDDGGNLVAFKRMDGAMLAAVDIAINKAYTAAATGFPTDELGKLAQPGQSAFGLALADQGRMIIFSGGLPIKTAEGLVGGLGVSGGLAPDDKRVAEAGIAALK